jgi:hypothetical protein
LASAFSVGGIGSEQSAVVAFQFAAKGGDFLANSQGEFLQRCATTLNLWRAFRRWRKVFEFAFAHKTPAVGFWRAAVGRANDRNPTSRLLLQILASVAEFEREMIRERTLSGIRAAQAAGKIVGRPKRVFRRDEVVRLRNEEGLSWRAIGKKLGIPAMTALDSHRNGCTETVSAGTLDSSGKRKKSTVAA